MSDLGKAIQSLRPNAIWILSGNEYSGIEWLDTEQTKPTENELNVEMARLESEETANAYKANRAKEYPSLADFADAYYWAQNGDDTKMTAYIEKCAEVKQKYPKS